MALELNVKIEKVKMKNTKKEPRNPELFFKLNQGCLRVRGGMRCHESIR